MAKKKRAKAATTTRPSKAGKARKAVKRSAKPAKAAKRSSRTARRKTASRPARATEKRAAKRASTPAARPAAKRGAKRPVRRRTTAGLAAAARKPAGKSAKRAPARKTTPALATMKTPAPARKPNLDRERRTAREEEMVPSPPSTLDLDRSASAARTGRAEYEQKLRLHTSTGPAMTGGDIDADWEDAATVGDEAPGGDNPTPDQDIVDEIGKALGVEYDDDQELQGGDEIVERDRHRWELDPASKEDLEDE